MLSKYPKAQSTHRCFYQTPVTGMLLKTKLVLCLLVVSTSHTALQTMWQFLHTATFYSGFNDDTDCQRMSFYHTTESLGSTTGKWQMCTTHFGEKIISVNLFGAKLFSLGVLNLILNQFWITLSFWALFCKLLHIFLNMPLIPNVCYRHLSCTKCKYQKVTMLITYETDPFYIKVQLNNCEGWLNVGMSTMRTFTLY